MYLNILLRKVSGRNDLFKLVHYKFVKKETNQSQNMQPQQNLLNETGEPGTLQSERDML